MEVEIKKSDQKIKEEKAVTTPKKTHTTSKSPAKVNMPDLKIEEKIVSQPSQLKKEVSQTTNGEIELWVDKYKPKTMNKIIGQSTDKSNASKLMNWLNNWQKWHSHSSDVKVKKVWNDQEGSSFKAALLSGPPGRLIITSPLLCLSNNQY